MVDIKTFYFQPELLPGYEQTSLVWERFRGWSGVATFLQQEMARSGRRAFRKNEIKGPNTLELTCSGGLAGTL